MLKKGGGYSGRGDYILGGSDIAVDRGVYSERLIIEVLHIGVENMGIFWRER